LDDDNDGIPNCIDEDEFSNWVCDVKEKKVLVCHIPPGNPSNAHTIFFSKNAASTHLDEHGDYIGECNQIFCEGNNMIAPPGNAMVSQLWSKGFQIYPNPTTDQLNIDLHNYLEQEISISIYNHLGQEVLYVSDQQVNNPVLKIDFSDQQLPNGIYLLSVRTAKGQETKLYLVITR
jgi:hypothetical protein